MSNPYEREHIQLKSIIKTDNTTLLAKILDFDKGFKLCNNTDESNQEMCFQRDILCKKGVISLTDLEKKEKDCIQSLTKRHNCNVWVVSVTGQNLGVHHQIDKWEIRKFICLEHIEDEFN